MKVFVLFEFGGGKELVRGVFATIELADQHKEGVPGAFILEFPLNQLYPPSGQSPAT